MDKRAWRPPRNRMKSGVEHCQPLSGPALAVLKLAQELRDGSDLVFPSALRPGRPIGEWALRDLLSTVGLDERTTVFGFRSTFRDWASECTDANHAVMELTLSHAVGSEAAWSRANIRSIRFEARLELLEEWGDYVCGFDETAPPSGPTNGGAA